MGEGGEWRAGRIFREFRDPEERRLGQVVPKDGICCNERR